MSLEEKINQVIAERIEYSTLNRHDLTWCIRRIPKPLRKILEDKPCGPIFLAGGFIRSCVANEEIQDIDLFVPSEEKGEYYAKLIAEEFKKNHLGGHRIHKTQNAFTIPAKPYTIQIITRWSYDRPEDIIPTFDFTIAQAVVYAKSVDISADRSGKFVIHWESIIHPDFYADLAGKRLVYCSPKRNEDAGGSMLRVLKFYQRGYRIPLDSLGAVIARLNTGLHNQGGTLVLPPGNEEEQARALTGLLREVDPAIDPTHAAHFPSDSEKVDKNNVEQEE